MQAFNHQRGQYLAVDDARIYYEEIGDKSKPVLVLLHGGLGNIEIFNGISPKLSKQFRIIGIDNRGQGASTLGSQSLTYGLFQKEVEAVLNHLNIKSLSLMGFSNGGTVAYRLAAFSKLDIQQVITLGSPWYGKHLEEIAEEFSKLTLKDWIQFCQSDYEAYQRLNPEPDLQRAYDKVVGLGQSKDGTGFPDEQVKKIKARVLAIRGEHDPVLSKNSLQILGEWIKGAKTVNIPDAGHEALKEQPKLFDEEVLAFLNG